VKFNTHIIIGALSLLLGACGSSSDSSTDASNIVDPLARYQGVWLAPAYGKGLEFDNNQLTVFDYTSDFCFIEQTLTDIDAEDLNIAFKLQNNNEDLEQRIGYGANSTYAPGTVFSKENDLPTACLQGFMPQQGDDNYVADFTKDLQYFYQTFKAHSVSIELQQIDWETSYMNAEQNLAANPTGSGLTLALINMIQPLNDGHTSIGDEDLGEDLSFSNKPYFTHIFIDEFFEINGINQIETPEQEQALLLYMEQQNDLLNDIIVSYVDSDSDIAIAANDSLLWFQVDGIGYIQIASMEGFADVDDEDVQEAMEQTLSTLERALDQAISDLQHTNGLIIDIRRNAGGMDFISLAIASRFTDQKVLAYKKQARNGSVRTPMKEVYISPRGELQYLNPVALLTSASTVSAAEVFSMSMSNLPNVTLIGETTQGEFSDKLNKKLPIGIPFSLSNEYYFTANDDWLEGKGVPVDIELPAFTQSERLAQEDLTLEAAFEFLVNQ